MAEVVNTFSGTDVLSSKLLIIQLVSKPVPGIEFTFQNYHYTVTYISQKSIALKKKYCVNASYIITMVNRAFVSKTEIKKITIKIPIRGLGSKVHHSDEFAILTFYMEGVLPDDTCAFTQITRKIHIIDNLKVGILIGADILTPERMIINFAIQNIRISSCRDIVVSMDSRARSEPVKRTVKSALRVILPLYSTQQVIVAYTGELLADLDLLFEPYKTEKSTPIQ